MNPESMECVMKKSEKHHDPSSGIGTMALLATLVNFGSISLNQNRLTPIHTGLNSKTMHDETHTLHGGHMSKDSTKMGDTLDT